MSRLEIGQLAAEEVVELTLIDVTVIDCVKGLCTV
jgi:hypothetical protein